MSLPLFDKLKVDGILGAVHDSDAIHTAEFSDALATALSTSTIRTAICDIFFRIGSYYITADATNPSTYLGGEWVAVEGKVLLGATAGSDSAYPEGSTGGSADAVAVTHTHELSVSTESAGAHTHVISGTAAAAGGHTHGSASANYYFHTSSDAQGADVCGDIGGGSSQKVPRASASANWSRSQTTGAAGGHTHSVSGSTGAPSVEHTHAVQASLESAGESGTGKNMMPYIAAYIWKRVA